MRLWHWVVVLLLPAMWLTAENGLFGIHRTLGIILAGLVVFRIFWGLFGSRTARFGLLLHSPFAIAGYARGLLRKGYKRTIGHNPLGGLSVIALMLALLAQVASGLFAVDTDGMNSGPLARFVSYDFADEAADFHETSFNILLALIGLHLAAITFYALVKRINLVGPMVTGRVRAEGEPNARPGPAVLLIGLGLAAAVAGILLRL